MNEDIIFNDADGTDKDSILYESLIYHTQCNSWDDPIFFIDSSEWGNSIIYDDQCKDIRYSLIITYRADGSDYKKITMFSGSSWKGENSNIYRNEFSTETANKWSYKDFLNYDDKGQILESSKEKFIELINRFMNAKAFL